MQTKAERVSTAHCKQSGVHESMIALRKAVPLLQQTTAVTYCKHVTQQLTGIYIALYSNHSTTCVSTRCLVPHQFIHKMTARTYLKCDNSAYITMPNTFL
jgi:hypothetical protein